MGKALYRKYRSTSLDEVVGQDHIVEVLRRQIAKNRVAHAYLLTGPRGVGKTSIARILAHAINQLPYAESGTHLDIIEIDAASNNGVDDIRDLRDKVQLAPTSAEKKVYIIDEVHMLSKSAFNALLKTLEEPPAHVVFILATTDVNKLPATIISRTQQFGFRAITTDAAAAHLAAIAKKEKIKIDDEALRLIAARGEGSFRDSISLLDQLASLADEKAGITAELVEQTLGLAPTTLVESLVDAYSKKDLPAIVRHLDDAESRGIQAAVLSSQLIDYLRRHIVEKPQYVNLLDQLVEVERSVQPSIKLLTVLAEHASAKPKSSPLLAQAPVVSAPIKELEKKATEKAPAEPTAQRPTAPRKKGSVSLTALDWNALIDYTRENYVAVYSVLSKCGFETTDDELILYTVNNFYKKKLDDIKYRQNLVSSLEHLGFSDVVIDTVPTGSPLKDEDAAKVAAIMGGGEEINLEENDS